MAERNHRRLREVVIPACGAVVLALLAGLYLGQRYPGKIWQFKNTTKEFVRDQFDNPNTVPWRHKGGFGMHVSDPNAAKGFLLVSAYFMDNRQIEIRLIDVRTGKTLKTWKPDPNAIRKRSDTTYTTASRFSPLNPLPMADGGLVFIDDGGPVVRIDSCSRIMWIAEGQYTHSLNLDLDGNLLVPMNGPPLEEPFEWLTNDYVTRLTLDGQQIDTVSIARMLIDNGLEALLTTAYPHNPIPVHLNKVEVAHKDGPFWKRGDWLISARALNLVMIYRPATGKIVWHSVGPWQKQHDPDFNPDGTISVFGNDTLFMQDGRHTMLNGHNDIYIVGPDKKITTPFTRVMAAEAVSTPAEGLQTMLPSGDVVVEETEEGRILRIGRKGVKWRFDNTDGKRAGQVHWSRYYAAGALPAGILHKCDR